MTTDKLIEDQIRDVLASELDAISLSNQLLSPGGLFNQLTQTESQRRGLVKTPLFKEAQRHISTLQRHEAREFAQTVEHFEAGRSGGVSLHRMERV